MNTPDRITQGEGLPRRSVLGLLLGSVLSACGGGGGTVVSGVSSGGTGSFTTGSIVGFGSIIVNGVRYDDAKAKVGDLDGDDHTGLGALKLGMVVAVQGSATTTANAGFNYTAEGTADQVVFLTELKGPISVVDATNLTFDVLGQRVRWSSTTIFDGLANSSTNLAADQEAEVYGLWNASAQEWQATRVETSVSTPAFYRLTGEVGAIDTVSQTLTISGQSVRYAGLRLDSNIAVGSRVRTVLNPTAVAGAWTATAVRLADWSTVPLVAWSPTDAEGHEAELEGIVTGLVGTRFELQGFEVDGAALNTALSNGQRVEVKGRFVNGVLVASSLEADGDSERESRGFELHGLVSGTTANSFVLRDFTITYDANSKGTAGLVDGAYVEAHIALQADGTWRAVELEVKSAGSTEASTESDSSNDHYGSDGETEDENDGD